MIKKNKVINNILLPKVLALTIIISLASGAGIYMTQEKSTKSTNTTNTNMYLLGIIALFIITAGKDVCSDYKRSTKFLSAVARKYIKQEQEKRPDLKQFEKVLSNQQAMQNVSASVFNNLRPSERKRVAQIILEASQNLRNYKKYGTEDVSSLKVVRTVLNDACNSIITILEEHASVHPEFIDNIYSVMANADMVYMMKNNSIKQNIR